MEGKDITPEFSLDEIDHHELLDVLTSRYTTSWRASKHAITFPASTEYKIKLQISHGQVERVVAGKALTGAELCELLAQVEADLKDDRIVEYGVDILFAHQPGYRRISLRGSPDANSAGSSRSAPAAADLCPSPLPP